MKRILAAVDLSDTTEPVVSAACEFAKAFDAVLLLLHVWVPETTWSYGSENAFFAVPGPIRGDDRYEGMRRREARIQAIEKMVRDRSIAVDSIVVQHAKSSDLIDDVRRLSPDLIVIGNHHHGPLHNLFFGTTHERLVRHAPCPVVMVPLPHSDAQREDMEKGAGAVDSTPPPDNKEKD